VNSTLHFQDAWANAAEVWAGTPLAPQLSAVSMVPSLAVATFGALARRGGPRWLQRVVGAIRSAGCAVAHQVRRAGAGGARAGTGRRAGPDGAMPA
jgi:hypothetical protein